MAFDYTLDYEHLDLRAQPGLYRVGVGEQGVLLVQPYKRELLPLWRFKTPEIAQTSADALWQRFNAYRDAGDFPGMDMARKFLQMGYTRARRYANHPGGRKYAPATRDLLPFVLDPEKARSAEIFKAAWQRAASDPEYRRRMAGHLARYESEGRRGRRGGGVPSGVGT